MSNPLQEGFHLASYDIIGSTNDEARKMAEKGAASGTVVWSRAQTAGKGRQGKGWVSPPGNLYVSVLLRMECDSRIASQMVFLSAVALRDAIPAKNLMFKWPNDILSTDGRKLAGILLEAKTGSSGNPDWVIIGAGVNIANHPPDNNLDRPATSLLKMLGRQVEVEELLQAFMDNFRKWMDIWVDKGFEPVRKGWIKSAAFLGEEVTVNLDKRKLTAKFKDINENGELVILLPDGQEIAISAGELFLGKAKNVTGD